MKTFHYLVLTGAFISVFLSNCSKLFDSNVLQVCLSHVPVLFFGDSVVAGDTTSFSTDCFLVLGNHPDVLYYHWNFGDGHTAEGGPDAYHVYDTAGTFKVKLKTEGTNTARLDSVWVFVANPATINDYVGTYNVNRLAVANSYISDITVSGANSITIHNFNNSGGQLSGTVNKNMVTIPQQIVSGDTLYGRGQMAASLNYLMFNLISDTPHAQNYIIEFRRR